MNPNEEIHARQPAADAQARDQLSALALEPGDVRQDFTASGYVVNAPGNHWPRIPRWKDRSRRWFLP
jgi:hypothetical protein